MAVDYTLCLIDKDGSRAWLDKCVGKDVWSDENEHLWSGREAFLTESDLGETFQSAGLELDEIASAIEGQQEITPGFWGRILGNVGNSDAFKIVRFGKIVYWSFTNGDPINDLKLQTEELGFGIDLSMDRERITECLAHLNELVPGDLKAFLQSNDIVSDCVNGTFIFEWSSFLKRALKEERAIIVEVPI